MVKASPQSPGVIGMPTFCSSGSRVSGRLGLNYPISRIKYDPYRSKMISRREDREQVIGSAKASLGHLFTTPPALMGHINNGVCHKVNR